LKVHTLSNKEEVVSPGAFALGETSFLIIDPRTTEGVGKVIMSEPYECLDGVCRDVVSWSPSGILAAMGITVIAVLIVVHVVEQVRRK
jgi:hypothetical protein